jgi:hypothetical protein
MTSTLRDVTSSAHASSRDDCMRVRVGRASVGWVRAYPDRDAGHAAFQLMRTQTALRACSSDARPSWRLAKARTVTCGIRTVSRPDLTSASAVRWPPGPATPPLRGSDNDFDEIRVEPQLADEIDCARISHLERPLLVLQPGDPNDSNRRLPPPDLACGLDAVHHWQRNVHQHDVGLKRLCKLDPFESVACPAGDFQASVRLQQLPQHIGKRIVALDHEYPQGERTDLPFSRRVRHRTTVAASGPLLGVKSKDGLGHPDRARDQVCGPLSLSSCSLQRRLAAFSGVWSGPIRLGDGIPFACRAE